MLGEDRACADSHVAARVERPVASYISGSQFFQVGKVNVQSWACVSFSCQISLEEIITVLSELRELLAPGMDIRPEPTFIHATTYSHLTDIEQDLLSARKFFCEQSNAEAKLLVILHDVEYPDGYLDELCKDIEVYQSFRCSPKPHKGDLKNVASEIMLKVLDFKARKSSVDGFSQVEEFFELLRGGQDTDGSYNNKNDIGAKEISEDKPSEKQQLHVEKSSIRKRKHADCDELHGAELIRDEEPQDANKDSSRSLELIWNDFIFTSSIHGTCGFHLRAPRSSAFLLSIWRPEAETKLMDKKDSCLPMIDHLKLFDTTGDYKFIGKMTAENRAPDTGSDHAAARVQSTNSTADNSSEGRKRPKAVSQVRKLDVLSWACVSFSHKSVEEIFTVLSELSELMATRMDISLEPSLFINAAYPDYTDMGQAMLSAREFFCEQSKTKAKLLLVMHDDDYSDGIFDDFCEEFGVTYQYCCSKRLNKKYLTDVVSEIMFKLLNFTALHFPLDRWDELMEDLASGLESYKKLFGAEDTHEQKRRHADCEGEVEPMDEERPVANKVKGSVKTWACVCFAPLSDYRIQKFSRKLRDKCVSIGMDFVWLPLLFVNKNPASSKDIEDCLWAAYEKFVDVYDLQCKLDLLTVILPQETDFHVPCAIPQGKLKRCVHIWGLYVNTLSAILPINEYLQKAAQEIRHEIVGRGELRPFVRKAIPSLSEHTIVFGADISPKKRGISLFSVVASMNWPEVSMYKHLVSCNEQQSEVVDDELVRRTAYHCIKRRDLGQNSHTKRTSTHERTATPLARDTGKYNYNFTFAPRHQVRNLSDHTYDDEIAAVKKSLCVRGIDSENHIRRCFHK